MAAMDSTETNETDLTSQSPGIKIEEWHDYSTMYEGKQATLIASGLFRAEWFPGQPGNGKSSTCFVFTDDTRRNGYIKKPGDKMPRENGFGRVRIISTGTAADPLFRAFIQHPPTEVARRKLEREACTGRNEWQLAKEAHSDKGEVFAGWRNAISYEIGKLEKLCTGEIVFTAMPDVRIKGDGLARVRDAVENLRRAFALTTPEMPDVVIRSNVYSIRDGAHRGLKKTD